VAYLGCNYELSDTAISLNIVTEFCGGGSLQTRIAKRSMVDPESIRLCTADMVAGLSCK